MELEIILIDINDHNAKCEINNELENCDFDCTESVRNSYHLIHINCYSIYLQGNKANSFLLCLYQFFAYFELAIRRNFLGTRNKVTQ